MTDSHLPPKRQLHPWLFMLGVPILAFGLLVVVAIVVAKYAPQPGALRDSNDHLMTDGTILRIEKVSFGKMHDFEYGGSGGGSWWGRLTGSRHSSGRTSWGTQHDQLVVFMSRRQPVTGQPLDFDWWAENVAIDAFGDRVPDSQESRMFQFGENGSSSTSGGQRPFKADHSQFDHWMVTSTLPPFRTAGDTVTIEVKNTSGEVVAKLDLQHPAPPTFPTWTAESLPCTKTDGDLGVTFKSAAIHNSGTHQQNGRTIQQHYLNAAIDLTWKGQPTTDWRQEWVQAIDPTGNYLAQWDSYSSPHEKVLKVNFSVSKHRDAKFDPAEQAAGATISLPAADKSVPLTDTVTLGGATLRLLFVEGTGKTSNPVPSALIGSHGNYSSSHGGQAFGKPSQFKLNTRNGSGTMEVEGDFPRLLIEKRGLSELHRLHVHVRDDQGRVVPVEEQYASLQELQLLFLKPEPDAKSISLTWTVTTSRAFEFFIEQPERPKPPEAKATK